MANDSERPHQDLPDPATAERTDGPRIADPHHDEPRETAAAAQDGMVASSRSEAQPQAESPAGPLPDSPISDLVQRLERLQPQIKETAPQLAGAINALSYSASQPDRTSTTPISKQRLPTPSKMSKNTTDRSLSTPLYATNSPASQPQVRGSKINRCRACFSSPQLLPTGIL